MRLRPTLYFEKKHADIYLEALDKACAEVKRASPYIFYDKNCSFDSKQRDELHRRSIENMEEFWGEQAFLVGCFTDFSGRPRIIVFFRF